MAITSRNPPQRQVLRGLGCTGKLPPLLSVVIYKYGVAPNPINKFPKPSWHPAALLWHCHHNLSAATAKISFHLTSSPAGHHRDILSPLGHLRALLGCVWAAGDVPEGARSPIAAPLLPSSRRRDGEGEIFSQERGTKCRAKGFILHGVNTPRRDGKGCE